MKHKIIVLLALLLCTIQSQIRENEIENNSFSFSPGVAGGQIELVSLLFVNEAGGVFDIDLLNKQSNINYSFGTRFGFEHYSYFEPGGPTGGSPFNDYCFFIRHSGRGERVHTNFMAGLAYHKKSHGYADEILFRTGIELRYNIADKAIALLLKGSTSFEKQTGYFGLGIAIGNYK